MYPEQGVQRRLRRLGFPRPIHLLAIDHGLSLGWSDQQDGTPAAVARRAVQSDVDGVVAHRGLLRELAADGIGNLILQLHGSTASDARKSPVAGPMEALVLDCAAVAVEIKSAGSSSDLATSSQLIAESHSIGLPVLAMISYYGDTWSAAVNAVIAAAQLGADLIKMRLPAHRPEATERATLEEVISQAPPVLLAGGPPDGSLNMMLQMAYDLKLGGTCIGRHYFTAALCAQTRKAITAAFGDRE